MPDKQAVAKHIYEQLTRSDSPVISNTARIALNSMRFEQTLAKALSVVYTDAGRASAVPVLEAALKSHPDDSRAGRWRNALQDAQFWLAVERGDAALNAKRFQEAERAYREACRLNRAAPMHSLVSLMSNKPEAAIRTRAISSKKRLANPMSPALNVCGCSVELTASTHWKSVQQPHVWRRI